MKLYKAGPAGLKDVASPSSWTTSLDHAVEYAAGTHGPHTPCLYVVDLPPTARVLDLRAGAADGLAEHVGLDLDDYQFQELQDLLRDVAPVIRASGCEWVAFHDRPEPDYDEWLYIGDQPVTGLIPQGLPE